MANELPKYSIEYTLRYLKLQIKCIQRRISAMDMQKCHSLSGTNFFKLREGYKSAIASNRKAIECYRLELIRNNNER